MAHIPVTARCILLLLMLGGRLNAQELIPFRYTSEDDNKLLKENDSVRYYAATGDTTNVVSINEEAFYYRLVNKKDRKKVVAEGGIIAEGEGYLQHGKWTQYYPSGKQKISGTYLRGKPAGAWEEYYPDGKLRKSYHYALLADKDGTYTCMSGQYNEYYENGTLKVNGFYLAERRRTTDTQTVEDPVSGTKKVSTIAKSVYMPRKTGPWEYYLDTGELDKREEL